MASLLVIELSSDEESDAEIVKDVKPNILSNIACKESSYITSFAQPKLEEHAAEKNRSLYSTVGVPSKHGDMEQATAIANGYDLASVPSRASVAFPRQFWKSGDYEVGQVSSLPTINGQNRLRIHPKFLHSNATSHKWAFGAIAELLDNAVDEVQNGATVVNVDKFLLPDSEDPALLIQDDGGGMDPEALRRCMSFGFSDKQSGCSIGQYGNGFKTSTMRLGADVVAFSRCSNKGKSTQSVGLLSYTFLRQTGANDIVVPVVDYVYDRSAGASERLIRYGEKQFSSNLSTILKWSPFALEDELLKQFTDIGDNGTKIIVYNLWQNDDGCLELDFVSDADDILISGSHKLLQTHSAVKLLNENHVSNRLRYSLRAYLSILYLRIPQSFRVMLRGKAVEHLNIVNDMKYVQCIQYKPHVGGKVEGEVVTLIGFLRDAPNINVHGFNVYHKNRLILPFWKVASNSYGKGRGVVGVLEANFVKPTHDKQDFEKSTLYQKLETRLREMTYEYWDYHCHLVGYKHSKAVPYVKNNSKSTAGDSVQQMKMKSNIPIPLDQLSRSHVCTTVRPIKEEPGGAAVSSTKNRHAEASENIQIISAKQQVKTGPLLENSSIPQRGLPEKRKYDDLVSALSLSKKQTIGNDEKAQEIGKEKAQEIITMLEENKKLRAQCLEFEGTVKDLLLKEQKLGIELQEVQRGYQNLLLEFKLMDTVKLEK